MSAKAVFLLAGDEQYLKEEWLLRTRRSLFNDDSQGVDFNIFRAPEMDLSEVVSIARTQPFLAKKRLIIIKSVDSLNSSLQRQQLLNYIATPSPYTVLVLEADIKEKALSSDKFVSEIAAVSEKVFFKKLYDNELGAWINKNFLLRKKRIAPAASMLLKELKGNDLGALSLEIEKLDIYTDQRPMVTLEDVRALVGNDITGNIYDMLDALSRNDKTSALTLGLTVQKKDLGSAIGLLCWNLRRLLKIREALKLGWQAKKIEAQLDLKKFQFERFMQQAKRLKTSWLKNALLEMAKLDFKLKSSSLDDSLLGWEVLITRLLTSA